MASSYINNLRLDEMATGDGSGTWGTTTNTNLTLIADAFGSASTGITGTTHTITIPDGTETDSQARKMVLTLTGSITALNTVTLAPNTANKVWIIQNSAGYAVSLTQGTGANVVIPNGGIKMVVADGAGSGAAITDVLDLTGGTGNVGLGSGNLGTALTTGTDNVAIGEASLDAVTTGSDNTVVGDNAGGALTTGARNVAVGAHTLATEDGNGRNIAVGYASLNALNAGADAYNVGIGYYA